MRAEGHDLRLVCAGTLTNRDCAAVTDAGLDDAVDYLGQLTRRDTLAVQRAASALLLVTSFDRSVATSKIFEYLERGGRSSRWLTATRRSGSYGTRTPA